MNQTSFGGALRAGRVRLGLSQRALADKLRGRGISVDQAAITRMETGQREPKLIEALQISDFLDFDVSTLERPDSEAIAHDGLVELTFAKYFVARESLYEYLNAVAMALATVPGDGDLFADEFRPAIEQLPSGERYENAAAVNWDRVRAFADYETLTPFIEALWIGLSEGSGDGPAA